MTYKEACRQAGAKTEAIVRRWFLLRHYCVIPVHAIRDGGAPLLVSIIQHFVLPDLVVAKGGRVQWVEVKHKTKPVYFLKMGRWRVGIDLPKWYQYLEVEQVTGVPGSLALVLVTDGAEGAPINPTLLLAPFARLEPKAQCNPEPHQNCRHGKAWWDADLFDRHAIPKEDAALLTPIAPRVHHPWEQRPRGGPPPRMGPPQLSLDYRPGDATP